MRLLESVEEATVASSDLLRQGYCNASRPLHVLHGRFVAPIWTENQCGASSTGCGTQASWFYEGDVRTTKVTCSLKIKEMIMPGIMSEGVNAGSGPRYGGYLGSRSWLRGV